MSGDLQSGRYYEQASQPPTEFPGQISAQISGHEGALASQLQGIIEQFLADLDQLVDSAALDLIRGALSPVAVSAATAARLRPLPVKRRQYLPGEISKAFLAHVQGEPGARLEPSAKALQVSLPVLEQTVAELLLGGRLRQEGAGWQARYWHC